MENIIAKIKLSISLQYKLCITNLIVSINYRLLCPLCLLNYLVENNCLHWKNILEIFWQIPEKVN